MSGPVRLEANGTLKERLTVESVEVGEGMVGGPLMRLKGSWLGLELVPKLPGIILSLKA